jgi:hypothetical protein
MSDWGRPENYDRGRGLPLCGLREPAPSQEYDRQQPRGLPLPSGWAWEPVWRVPDVSSTRPSVTGTGSRSHSGRRPPHPPVCDELPRSLLERPL